MAFLHAGPESIPARHTDRDPELQRKLAAFRTKVQKRLCKFWSTPGELGELGTAITTSYVRLIKTHPAEGRVRAKYVKTTEDAQKVTSLLDQVRKLEQEIEALRRLGVADSSGLAKGEDSVRLEFRHDSDYPNVLFDTTWNAVFAAVGKVASTSQPNGVYEAH